LAFPNTVLNTIAAEAIDALADGVEQRMRSGSSVEQAVLDVVKETYSENRRIVFDGDNYSPEWHQEAERRGLANLRQTPDALPWLIEQQTIQTFENYEVLSNRELEARYEVSVEQYTKTINIESDTAAAIARTQLLPAAISYLKQLEHAGASKGITRIKDELTTLVDDFVDSIYELDEANSNHPTDESDVLVDARYVQQQVLPAMESVRSFADRLERIVPDTSWPLPKYSEILFIK
jgi:glutamine synthetase